MTALPQPLDHVLTVAEYAGLGETEVGYTELLEGRLLTSPSPAPDHNFAAAELLGQLRPQIPDHLEVIQDVDVDLELAGSDQPGFSDAGIPHYWIVDLDEPVSLLTCHLAEGFGYQDAGGSTGACDVTEPFPAQLRLDRLL